MWEVTQPFTPTSLHLMHLISRGRDSACTCNRYVRSHNVTLVASMYIPHICEQTSTSFRCYAKCIGFMKHGGWDQLLHSRKHTQPLGGEASAVAPDGKVMEAAAGSSSPTFHLVPRLPLSSLAHPAWHWFLWTDRALAGGVHTAQGEPK